MKKSIRITLTVLIFTTIQSNLISAQYNELTIGTSNGAGVNVNSMSGYDLGIHHSGMRITSVESATSNVRNTLIDLVGSEPGAYGGIKSSIDFSARDRGNDQDTGVMARITGGLKDGTDWNSSQRGFLSFGTAGMGSTTPTTRLVIDDIGNVGIGTTNPGAKLSLGSSVGVGKFLVYDGTDPANNLYAGFSIDRPLANDFTMFSHQNGDLVFGKLGTDKSTFTEFVRMENNGTVGIGTPSPSSSHKLTVQGNILVRNASGTAVAELGEGLDYAEGFDVSQDEKVTAGTVLVLDELNPGKLKVCDQAYDKKVAGIASGAKGLGSGVRLGVGQFDCDVALAGRVYCNVDATDHAIEVGDPLTTSDLSGYAMKAVDLTAAQCAILGKAMQSLDKGQKGQILVLVTLQ